MKHSPVPRHTFRKYADITPAFLNNHGIKFLMLDLDNTIAKYSEPAPSAALLQWASMMAENGIALHIVSNSRRKDRVEAFAAPLGVGYIKIARKPSPRGVRQALETCGFASSESALVGDQAYTDVIAANRAGTTSIIVRPLDLRNPLFLLRYAIELPFRAMCAVKTYKERRSMYYDE